MAYEAAAPLGRGASEWGGGARASRAAASGSLADRVQRRQEGPHRERPPDFGKS